MSSRSWILALAAGLALVLGSEARAALVSGWGLETGASAATLTEGAPGSFSTTTPSGNASPRALLASPVSLANVGDMVLLRGAATLQNALGNQQFRFGLFNTNGQATGTLAGGVWSGATSSGWLGYMAQIGNTGGTNSLKGRNATGAWFSNTGAYEIGNSTSTTSPAGATAYNFSLKLTRTGATSVDVAYSFIGGTENRSGIFTDNNAGASAATASINSVGFLLNGNTGSGTFTDVRVSVPEPATAGMFGALLASTAALVRRRTIVRC